MSRLEEIDELLTSRSNRLFEACLSGALMDDMAWLVKKLKIAQKALVFYGKTGMGAVADKALEQLGKEDRNEKVDRREGGERVMKSYGKWAGNPQGTPENIEYCIKEIWHRDLRSSCQCLRKRGYGRDGLYCKPHEKEKEDE